MTNLTVRVEDLKPGDFYTKYVDGVPLEGEVVGFDFEDSFWNEITVRFNVRETWGWWEKFDARSTVDIYRPRGRISKAPTDTLPKSGTRGNQR